jgi:hypothetical protein
MHFVLQRERAPVAYYKVQSLIPFFSGFLRPVRRCSRQSSQSRRPLAEPRSHTGIGSSSGNSVPASFPHFWLASPIAPTSFALTQDKEIERLAHTIAMAGRFPKIRASGTVLSALKVIATRATPAEQRPDLTASGYRRLHARSAFIACVALSKTRPTRVFSIAPMIPTARFHPTKP